MGYCLGKHDPDPVGIDPYILHQALNLARIFDFQYAH
jgi:hypothetical protein